VVRVGFSVAVGVKVGRGITVSVGLTSVISAKRCGPAQDTSPAPSAARNPFWRNLLLVSFLLTVTVTQSSASHLLHLALLH